MNLSGSANDQPWRSALHRTTMYTVVMPRAAQLVELSEHQIQLIAKALADPRRYEILSKIGRCPQTSMACSEVRECIDISPATLSHHMKELETAGLIRSEKEGKFVRYHPRRDVLRAYLDRLKSDLFQGSVS